MNERIQNRILAPIAALVAASVASAQQLGPLLVDRRDYVAPSGQGAGFNGRDASVRSSCVMGYQNNAFGEYTDMVIEAFSLPIGVGGSAEVGRVRIYVFYCDTSAATNPVSRVSGIFVRLSRAGQMIAESTELIETGFDDAYRVQEATGPELTSPLRPVFYADALFPPGVTVMQGEVITCEMGARISSSLCMNEPAAVPNQPSGAMPANWSLDGDIILCDPVALGCATGNPESIAFRVYGPDKPIIGLSYCGPAIPNSTGSPGVIIATGSEATADNNVTLTAEQLPPSQFGYFLVGQTQGFFNPPGSSGFLCLMGNIGRYVGQIIQGPTGSIVLDLTSAPVNPPMPIQPGETWNFQCWYRDANPAVTSNFTDGVTILFQ